MKKDQIISAYKLSTKTNLFEVYERPSQKKISSYTLLLIEMRKNNGKNMKILSHNTNMYTCAYEFEKDGKRFLKYHSKTKELEIAL